MFYIIVIIFTFILLYRDYRRDKLTERSLKELKDKTYDITFNYEENNKH